MFRRLNWIKLAPFAAVALALAAIPATPALAGGGMFPAGTPQCHVLPGCGSILLYGSPDNPFGQALTVTAGRGSRGSAPVVVHPDSITDPGQDWTLIFDGLVSAYAATGEYGLTAFDFANYGSARLISLEFTPAGIPTGYCAANVSERMVLRTCNGSVFQTFLLIGTTVAVRGTLAYGLVRANSETSGVGVILSAVQAKSIYHHYAATGSLRYDVQVSFATLVARGIQAWNIGAVP